MSHILELARKSGATVLTNGVEHRVTFSDATLAAFTEAVRQEERERAEQDARRPSDELQAYRRQELVNLMRYISEDCYCAGWYNGLEYILWEMVSDPKASRDFGIGIVSEDDITKLRTLAEQTGGWWRWHDDSDERDLPAEEWGERFTPMAEWLVMYERHRAILAQPEQKP